jgi:DNA-binding IscR family transcriptional regulator
MKLNLTRHIEDTDNILLRSSDKTMHVLYYIICQFDMINDSWYSDKINKEFIATKLNLSLSSIDKKVSHLKDSGIIIKKSGKGEYKLNEDLFELGY